MKRYLSFALVLLLLTMALPALAEDPMQVSIGMWGIGEAIIPENLPDGVLSYVQDKFNIQIVPQGVTWGDYKDKYTLWAASDNLPDICGANDIKDNSYVQWVQDGVIRALPDDLSPWPNIQRHLSAGAVSRYSIDGKSYLLPRVSNDDASYTTMDRGMIIRKDWLDNLGLSMPTTTDELIDVMKAFTENDPDGNGKNDTYGFLSEGTDQLIDNRFADMGFTDSAQWIKVDGEYVLPVMEKGVIPLMDKLRTAYNSGWIYPDFATTTNTDDVINMFVSGRVGCIVRQVSPKHLNNVKTQWDLYSSGKDFFSSVAIVPFSGENCMNYEGGFYWSETYISSKVDDEKMTRILDLFDWLYSDEGIMLVKYGIEGEDYHYDEKGEIVLTYPTNAETGKAMTREEKYPAGWWLDHLAVWTNDSTQFVDPTIPAEIRALSISEYERRMAQWKSPSEEGLFNAKVDGLVLEEKAEMTATHKAWATVITDGSDATTEELYEQLYANWVAQGYEACKIAVNAAANALE